MYYVQYATSFSHRNPFLHIFYTHFNTLKKKALGKHCGKRWNCSNQAISPFPTMISIQFVFQNPSIATFQLSSAASLNFGRYQNGILGNGLKVIPMVGRGWGIRQEIQHAKVRVNQRTDSPESRLVYTRLEVALQILERKIHKNTKISSLYS